MSGCVGLYSRLFTREKYSLKKVQISYRCRTWLETWTWYPSIQSWSLAWQTMKFQTHDSLIKWSWKNQTAMLIVSRILNTCVEFNDYVRFVSTLEANLWWGTWLFNGFIDSLLWLPALRCQLHSGAIISTWDNCSFSILEKCPGFRRTGRARLTWKAENCNTGNREVVWGKTDVLALETVSETILRGGGKNETFLENQHSLSAGHSVKLTSDDNWILLDWKVSPNNRNTSAEESSCN